MRYVAVMLLLLLSSAGAFAHGDGVGHSAEPIIVRVFHADVAASTYTMQCSLPEGADPLRTWNVHNNDGFYELVDYQSMNETVTVTLTQDDYFHFTCGTFNSTTEPKQWIASDIHIDLRPGPDTDRPNVNILASDGPSFTASCTHESAIDPEEHWTLYFPQTGVTTDVPAYDGMAEINHTLPEPGLWSILCGIWDNGQSLWLNETGLDVEFFSTGPAYVPTAEGCIPAEGCDNHLYEVPANETVPTIALQVYANASGGHELVINTTNFTFVNASLHVPGEGHVHWYLDGVKQGLIYNPVFHTVLPTGLHEVTARLATNDHQEYAVGGLPIEDRVTLFVTAENGTPAPQWLEPSLGSDHVDPLDFHIQVFQPVLAQGVAHNATDFELWDVLLNERVWSSINETEILYHIHNVDGLFENTLSGQGRLNYDTDYRLRARFQTDDGNLSAWSEWRDFRTRPEYVFNESPFLWTAREGYTVELVAANISVPVNVEMAPSLYGHLPEGEQPLLYVTQLYGQIGVVLKNGTYQFYAADLLNYESFGSLPGSGEAGVTGLYVDPVTGDLFVSMVYNEPGVGFLGKVDRFVTGPDGETFVNVSTILDGLPSAPSHQVHTISRGPDGKLYLHVGDDDNAFASKNPAVLSGKILRFNDDGSMPSDNPFPGTYVYAAGFRNPFGGAWRPGTNEYFVSNNGPDENDSIYLVGAGETFGWCCSTAENAWHLWPETVAPVAVAFDTFGLSDGGTDVEPVNFANGVFFAATSAETYLQGQSPNAKRIYEFHIAPDGSKQLMEELVTYTGNGYGTPIGLAMGADGLYFTDIYGEVGFVGVGETRGNVYKVIPGNQTPENGTNETSFSAAIGTAAWYPQGLNVIWECKPVGGSGTFLYDYVFGDGQGQYGTPMNNTWHTYPANGTYNVSCAIHDQVTEESAFAATTIVLGNGEGGGSNQSGNGTLTIQKILINDNNGTKGVLDFDYFVVVPGPAEDYDVLPGQVTLLPAGAYSVLELNTEGYTVSYGGDCAADGSVTLAAGENKTCVITNDDIDPEAQLCHETLETMPATCTGGIITQDTYDGCRTITCAENNDSLTFLKVLACDKPGSFEPTHFEIYRQQQTGGSFEICFLDTCMSDQGFVMSDPYPLCSGEPLCTDGDSDGYSPEGGLCGTLDCNDNNESVSPAMTEACNGIDDNCNGIIDEDGVCPSVICGDGLVESPEECDDNNTVSGDGCSATCMVESGACFDSVELMPASCSEGAFTTDTYNGCRQLVCSGKQVLACNKPDNTFEMYNQGGPASVSVCLGDLCMTGQGFLKSTAFPLCLGNATIPVCGDGLVESPEECDDNNTVSGDGCSATCALEVPPPVCGNGLVEFPEECDDNNTVSGDGCSATCTLESGNVSAVLSMAPWFPQGNNAVLVCSVEGFAPSRYDWFFGDGEKQLWGSQDNVWHTYPGPGNYSATCIASDASNIVNASLPVTLS